MSNFAQNICNKVKKSTKLGPEKKTLLSTFAYFLI